MSSVIFSDAVKVYPGGSKWNLPFSVRQKISGLQRRYDFTILDGWQLGILDEFCVVIRANTNQVNELRNDSRIVDVQRLNHFVALKSIPPYNDPRLRMQLGNDIDSLSRLHHWSTGNNIRVGIIDTPIDTDHPDLKSKIHSQQIFVKKKLTAEDLLR